MSHDTIKRLQRIYPDWGQLKQQLAQRLRSLDEEIGEQVRGQERAIVVGRGEEPYTKLRKLLHRDLVFAELTSVDRLARGYPLTDVHISALEAIIDESMPFLVIRDGDFTLPDGWQDLEPQRTHIRNTLMSVGRIGNAGSKLYWGTGFLVARDVVMTNWHVVFGHVYPKNGKWEFYPHLNVEIDFRMEYQTRASFKTHCVQVIGRHSDYDLALLRVEKEITEIRPLTLSSSTPQDLQVLSIYLIGHPYVDSRLGASREVQRRLFLMDQTIGYKHLLLGYTEPLMLYQPEPELAYPRKPYLCHTGSTLPGNSGSCVVDVQSHQVIGLHCAGDNIAKRNYAVPLWKLKEDKLFQEANIRFA